MRIVRLSVMTKIYEMAQLHNLRFQIVGHRIVLGSNQFYCEDVCSLWLGALFIQVLFYLCTSILT